MFQNIPRSPGNTKTEFLQTSTQQQGVTQSAASLKITPILPTYKSTQKPNIFAPLPNNNNANIQNIQLHHGQRFSATAISLPSQAVNVSQAPSIQGRFFMSPQNSEKRLHSQDSIRTIQHHQLMSSNQNNNNTDLFNTQNFTSIHTLQRTQQAEQYPNINQAGDRSSQPLIQSVIFQPTQNSNNGDQIRGINEHTNDNGDQFGQNYPFKPTQESKFEVSDSQNIAFTNITDTVQITSMHAQQQDEECRNLAQKLIASHKRAFEESLLLNTELIKTQTQENQKKLEDIKEFISLQKNEVLSKLSKSYLEKYENIAQEQAFIHKKLQEYEQSIKVRVEEQYLQQMGKQMNEQISKLVESKWNETELGVQKQIQDLQNVLSGFDDKQSQAFIEVGNFLTKLKTDIEKVFFEGQGYFKANLDAFGLNLADKINTSDVKSAFTEMNEGFYERINPGMDSLKVRVDAISGNIKAMEEEQSKKVESLESQLNNYFQSLANGVEQLSETQNRADKVANQFQNACSSIHQYKNKIDILESIVRNLVMTSKNHQSSNEAQLQLKLDKLVEALSKMQENFKQLKAKYEQESVEWKKQGTMPSNNSTLNDSKVMHNMSSQSIASFNSQLIQLTNQNKQLMESMKFKEQMIQEQKMLIENFEKKVATQQQQLTSLLQELKQIKQESKQRQNVIQEVNNSMFSSIQSANHSIADSLQNDFVNNIQNLNQNKNQQKHLIPYDFNQLEDYQEDQEDGDFEQDQEYFEDNQLQTEEYNSEKEIQEYFKKLKTDEVQRSDKQLTQYDQDFFFYPYSNTEQSQNDNTFNQTREGNRRELKTLTSPSQSQLHNRQQLLQSPQQSNLFTKKPLSNSKQPLKPRRTLPKRLNTESNIENHQPTLFIRSPTATSMSLSKIPVLKESQNIKDQVLKTEGNVSLSSTIKSTSFQNTHHLSSSNSSTCFTQPLKNASSPLIPNAQSTQDASKGKRLLYNNTLKEQKEQCLKVKLETNNKLKDEFGKFIYDKNGQAIQFTSEQLDYLQKEAQIIEIITNQEEK